MLAYRKAVVRRAWDRFKTRLFDGARQVMSFLVQTAILFAILYYQPWFGDIRSEGRLAAAGVASVLLSVLLSFLWDIIRAPEIIWTELTARIDDLQRAIRPKFSVLVNHGGETARGYQFGPTHRSPYTGSAQSVVQHTINALAIDVTNESAITLEGCEAYLSRFEEVGGEPGVFHSMRLGWVPVGDEVSVVNIPPSGQRTVIAFQVVGTRAIFSHDQMPIQAVHMIKEDGSYWGVITLSAKNTTAAFAAFRLTCIKGEPPFFSLMRRGFNEVEFLGWAPETFIGI